MPPGDVNPRTISSILSNPITKSPERCIAALLGLESGLQGLNRVHGIYREQMKENSCYILPKSEFAPTDISHELSNFGLVPSFVMGNEEVLKLTYGFLWNHE